MLNIYAPQEKIIDTAITAARSITQLHIPGREKSYCINELRQHMYE